MRCFEPDTGRLGLVNLNAGPVGRAVFEPGWQWPRHVKPMAQTDSCQASHIGYIVSGHMKTVMDDGDEDVFGPGDFVIAPSGHDAWTLGDQPCVMIDWQASRTTPNPDPPCNDTRRHRWPGRPDHRPDLGARSRSGSAA